MRLPRKKLITKRIQLIIIGLVIVCVAPILYAWYLHKSQPPTVPLLGGHGFHIKPPIDFTQMRLTNRWGVKLPHSQWQYNWVLLYVSTAPCDNSCHSMLEKMQIVSNGSQGRYKQPVDNLVLTFTSLGEQKLHDLMAHNYPDFLHAYIHLQTFKRLFNHAPELRRATFQGMLYLVAPDGKISLAYTMQASDTAISAGLNSLLTQQKT